MKTIFQLVQEMDAKQVALKDTPCNCNSYRFPHRRGGGKCVDDHSWMTLSERLAHAKYLDNSEKYYS
jgi:hypothetical protein